MSRESIDRCRDADIDHDTMYTAGPSVDATGASVLSLQHGGGWPRLC